MKGKYLLPILALLLTPAVFAQSVDIKFVEYPEYITPETLQQTTLSLKLVVNVNAGGYQIVDPTLYVYVLGEDGRILYEEESYISLEEGVNIVNVYVPGSVIVEKLSKEDDFIKVYAKVLVTFSDGSNVEPKPGEHVVTIYVKDNMVPGKLDILYIAPDLSKQKEFDRKVYTFIIGIKNNDDSKADNVAVHLRVYDQYGVRKINLIDYISIDPQEYVEVKFNVNFGTLEPGYYTLVIEVYNDGSKIFEKECPIVVAPSQIKAIKVYDVSILPPEYGPGDLVLVKMILRNVLDKPIVVKPELISEDLNLYRALSSFELAPGEAKEFKVVIPLPEDLKSGKYYVTVRFVYNQYIKQDYKVMLRIPGETEVKLVTAELLAPSRIPVGKSETVRLILTSHVEDLIPVKIEVYATKADIEILKDQLVIGGAGLKKEVTLYIVGEQAGSDTIIVEVIDLNTGKVIAKIEQPIEIITSYPEQPAETPEGQQDITGTEPGKEKIQIDIDKLLMLVGVIIILAAVVFFLMRKREGEEKPSE